MATTKKFRDLEMASIIERARGKLSEDQKNQPARVADEIAFRFRRVVRLLPSVLQNMLRDGIYQFVMRRFKAMGLNGVDSAAAAEDHRQAILDLWTNPAERAAVVRFGDIGFYLPKEDGADDEDEASLGKYLDLTPDRTSDEVRAGAAHKRKYGEFTLKQADALDALADLIERRRSVH